MNKSVNSFVRQSARSIAEIFIQLLSENFQKQEEVSVSI